MRNNHACLPISPPQIDSIAYPKPQSFLSFQFLLLLLGRSQIPRTFQVLLLQKLTNVHDHLENVQVVCFHQNFLRIFEHLYIYIYTSIRLLGKTTLAPDISLSLQANVRATHRGTFRMRSASALRRQASKLSM